MDIMAYAMKKEKGNRPVNVPDKTKLSLTFGLMEPRMFVRNEMAKKTRKIRMSRNSARFIDSLLICLGLPKLKICLGMDLTKRNEG